MKVVVAGANSQLATRTIPLLMRGGHEVVGLVRSNVETGATTTVADWMSSSDANAHIASADAVLNLTGQPNPPRGEGFGPGNVGPAERLLAARDVPAKFALTVSYIGADATSTNAYIRAKGEVEELTRKTAHTACILRASVLVGEPDRPLEVDKQLIAPVGKRANALGDGKSQFRPVLINDAAALVVAAMERELAGTYALEGPDQLTLDQFVRVLNRDEAKKVNHMPGWAAVTFARQLKMNRDLVRLFLENGLAQEPNAFDEIGLPSSHLATVWTPLPK